MREFEKMKAVVGHIRLITRGQKKITQRRRESRRTRGREHLVEFFSWAR
jgi:hypothetical protein